MKVDIGLLILRLGFGGMMLFAHGWPKLANFTNLTGHFPDPIGLGSTLSLTLAVFSEFFCSIALMAGVLTRWVSIPLLITMLVAAFIVHADDSWKDKEFALLYAIPFLAFFFTGGGRFSLDTLIGKNR